ncbi:MAG: hypothetical protein IKW02_00770 [Clostridia bacterium]|nr:hypothetical protein [Clostridia bacterium]
MKKISKKAIIITVAIVLVVAIAVTSVALIFGGGDFRRTKWGMSPEQVKRVETAKLIDDNGFNLKFMADELEGVDVKTYMFYDFDGYNGLWQVTMGYNTQGFKDKTANKIIEAFEKKYGEPTKYEETQLCYDHYWVDDRTEIKISQQSSYLMVSFTDVDYVINYED